MPQWHFCWFVDNSCHWNVIGLDFWWKELINGILCFWENILF